jgi:hypothetical protein
MVAPTRKVSAAALCLAALSLTAGAAHAAKGPTSVALPAGSRVGVIDLLAPELTHFHGSRRLENSFLKTYGVNWPVNAMLLAAVADRLAQLGLVALSISGGEELMRTREDCFLNAQLAKGLPKECAPVFERLAAAEHLSAMIVLGPGRNDSNHAGGSRHRELPEYLRGWGFTTFEGYTTPPQLLNLTELLLVNVTPDGAQLVDHEWGGDGGAWTGYKPPADIKSIPDQQLKQLQPLFAALLQQQGASLLTHLQVAH